jgi:aryl-alcohol dehydrogenase-like predicted oxidoreductase
MRYNQLGRTGLFVSELCLGTMTFGEATDGIYSTIAGVGQDGVDAIVKRALDAGVNFIDTADVYSQGRSEELLGQSLKNLGTKRSDVVVATKFYGVMGEGPNDRGGSRGHILDAVAASLKRLQTDHIDLYQIHAFDTATPMEETLRALDDLVSRGMVRYVGCSNWPAWRLAKALGVSERLGYARYETIQSYYTIAGRDLEREIVPLLQEEKVGLMVWSPLAGGLLSGKYSANKQGPEGSRRTSFDFPPVDLDRAWKVIDAMREIGDAKGVSVARVALAWLLHKPYVTSVIIGAKRLEQLEDNLAAVTLSLTDEEMAKLDEVSALPREYPGWMLARQGATRLVAPVEPDRE